MVHPPVQPSFHPQGFASLQDDDSRVSLPPGEGPLPSGPSRVRAREPSHSQAGVQTQTHLEVLPVAKSVASSVGRRIADQGGGRKPRTLAIGLAKLQPWQGVRFPLREALEGSGPPTNFKCLGKSEEIC